MIPAEAVPQPRQTAMRRSSVTRSWRLAVTFFALSLAVLLALPVLRWAVLNAAFLPAIPETCQARTGACWSFVIAKHGQILFGIYPDDERWRPAVTCVLLIVLLVCSMQRRLIGRSLAWVWAIALPLTWLLMAGGVFGLAEVATDRWGGLPVTLLLTVAAVGGGFPVGILLALARTSTLPALRTVTIVFVETVRGLPLLSILFIASIMLPLLLPEEVLPDKFFRALIALLIFSSCYMAEVVRGGLRAVQTGQYEAAASLGLGYWHAQGQVILPQAIRVAIPALTNTVIVMIKNTSLVLVVGLFDLISSGKAALADPAWQSPSVETYLFICLIYFTLCFGFSRFIAAFERRDGKN
jgi:general L-amino acid transport system permease protein